MSRSVDPPDTDTRTAAQSASKVRRGLQVVLIFATIVASWLGMQAVHELGHVVGARLTGGRVSQVVLNPLTISRTDVAENPHPLIVVWAGPVIGCLLPLLAWGIAVIGRMPNIFLCRFFAGFCLVANGAYIAIGSWDRIGDCGEMLRHGSVHWQLWAFGVITVPLGFRLWHGLGHQFGLGASHGKVSTSATVTSLIAMVALLAVGFAVGGS